MWLCWEEAIYSVREHQLKLKRAVLSAVGQVPVATVILSRSLAVEIVEMLEFLHSLLKLVEIDRIYTAEDLTRENVLLCQVHSFQLSDLLKEHKCSLETESRIFQVTFVVTADFLVLLTWVS